MDTQRLQIRILGSKFSPGERLQEQEIVLSCLLQEKEAGEGTAVDRCYNNVKAGTKLGCGGFTSL